MQPYDPSTACVGDWICRPSILPTMKWLANPSPTLEPTTHHGVVVAVAEGKVVVFDINGRYRRVPLAEFADGKPVSLVAKGIAGQEEAVVARANETAKKDQSWSLFWACDDVAAHVYDGRKLGEKGQGREELRATYEVSLRVFESFKK